MPVRYDIIGTPLHIDAFDLLAQLPDESVNLVFCDPPYNIGIFSKMPADEYLDWCERWIAEASRVLVPNGAFWISHKDPSILVEISRKVAAHGRGRVNWVTWDKYNGASTSEQYVMNKTKLHPQGKRSFDQDAEYLVYHAGNGCFLEVQEYFENERQRAGVDKVAVNVACGFSATPGGMASRHYFSKSQWCLPTAEHYAKMQRLFNANNGTESEYLCREYEDLRYTFNNPGKVSSVWQIPPASKNGHPTPKPEALLERIIKATSNEGDIVLDFFAGSFTTAAVAQRLGRRWICGDKDADYVRLGEKRLRELTQMELELAV